MSTVRSIFAAVLIASGLLVLAAPAAAQDVPLERFVRQVLYLWREGDAGGLVELAPESGEILLDNGWARSAVRGRHAAGALRALFGEGETLAVETERITFSGGEPARGFAELSWRLRTRGAPDGEDRVIYVGALWEDGRWRIEELRVLR